MHTITLLLSLAIPLANAQYGTCTSSSGIVGECISTTECAGAGGSSEAGLCPGDSTIQCCSYGSCTSSSGVAGTCQPSSTCGGTTEAGLCPGDSDILCCTASEPPSSGCGPPQINDATLTLLKDSESPECSPTPYDDPSGYPTIGYGHLCIDDACSDVSFPIPLSADDCNNLLRQDLSVCHDLLIVQEYEECVANGFASSITLNDNQYGAFVDFIFNLGCGITEDAPFTRINAGEDPATVVQEEFPKYVNSNGVQLPGLVTRRNNEIELFNTPSSNGALPYGPC